MLLWPAHVHVCTSNVYTLCVHPCWVTVHGVHPLWWVFTRSLGRMPTLPSTYCHHSNAAASDLFPCRWRRTSLLCVPRIPPETSICKPDVTNYCWSPPCNGFGQRHWSELFSVPQGPEEFKLSSSVSSHVCWSFALFLWELSLYVHGPFIGCGCSLFLVNLLASPSHSHWIKTLHSLPYANSDDPCYFRNLSTSSGFFHL